MFIISLARFGAEGELSRFARGTGFIQLSSVEGKKRTNFIGF